MPWLKLDDAFWARPKVMAAGNEVAGAFVRMLSYCSHQLTDGHIPEDIAKVIAKPGLLSKLITFEFIEEADKGFVIPDYLEYNNSREKVEEIRATRRTNGSKGGSKPRKQTVSK